VVGVFHVSHPGVRDGMHHYSDSCSVFYYAVLIGAALLNVFKEQVPYVKLWETIVQVGIVGYIFLSLMQWQNSKEAANQASSKL
jgi:hypothetical protein